MNAPPIPVTVLGGYLGAGKTTLVNRMLRDAAGARLAVLVNEFGALPIDADLIEARDGDLISLSGGCVCCAFGSDLAGALRTLAALSPPPDHIVLEASGVALPAGIAANVAMLPEMRVDAVTVLADTLHVMDLAADAYVGDTITRQLGQADMIALTKTDLASFAQRDAVAGWLATLCPAVPALDLAETGLSTAILGRYAEPRTYPEKADHAQGHASVSLRFGRPRDPHALARRLTDPDLGVIRAKGHVIGPDGGCVLIQLAGRRIEVTQVSGGRLGLVCIGPAARLDRAALERLADD